MVLRTRMFSSACGLSESFATGAEHHEVLVEVRVDLRHQALAERAVQRRIDRAHAHLQLARCRTIDAQHLLLAHQVEIAGDVAEFLHGAHLPLDLQRPWLQVAIVAVDQLEFVLAGIVAAAATADELHRCHRDLDVRQCVVLLRQPLDHRLDALVALTGAFATRFEVDEHLRTVANGAAIATVGAKQGQHIRRGRIGHHDLRQVFCTVGHEGRCDVRIGADLDLQLAGVLVRHEGAAGGLGHGEREHASQDQQYQRLPAHDAPMVHRPVQRTLIGAVQVAVETLHRAFEPARRAADWPVRAPAGARTTPA